MTSLIQSLAHLDTNEVRHAMPALIWELCRTQPLATLPLPLREILTAWWNEVGLDVQATDEDVITAMTEYYQARPIAQDVKAVLIAQLHDEPRERVRLHRLLGTTPPPPPPVPAAAAGQVNAGPLARFRLAHPPQDNPATKE